MSERSDPFTIDEELEQRLRDLSGAVHFPETPDFAAMFQRDIVAKPVPISSRRPVARIILAAAVALLILGATLALIPGARHAVADWLDIPGLRLTVGDDAPIALPATPETSLAARYGPAVSLELAAAVVNFPLLLPAHPSVTGTPAIYFAQEANPVVLIAYPPGDALPEAAQSGVGLLLVEFRAGSDTVWGMKQAGTANDISVVRIAGVEALWIGGVHTLMIAPSAPGGTPVSHQSANVLAWNVGGVTYRLEADLPIETMIAIAESLGPAN